MGNRGIRNWGGESVEDLMEAFGRQRGSIRARIVKLGLVEE